MFYGFANDYLFGIDRKKVEVVYVPLKREIARIGLTINSTNTMYMVAGRNRGRLKDVMMGAKVCLLGCV